MAKRGNIEVVWAIELLREKGTTVWHRPAPLGGVFCGARIGAPEQLLVEAEAWPPADGQLCPLCEQLFKKECARAMGRVVRMALEAARRHAEERQPAGEGCAGIPAD